MKRTLMRNVFTDDIRVKDKKLKFIEERLNIMEQFVPELTNRTSEYLAKKSAEKKSIDKVLVVLINYANSESVSESMKSNVERFARILADVSVQNEGLVNSISEGPLEELADFGKRSKHLRVDIKNAVTAAEKEVIRQRQLQRLEMLRDQDHQRLSSAEADAIKAKSERAKALKALEDQADAFELSKLQGIKSALLTWTTIELRYHARCLELFTEAYRAAAHINVASDHQEFRCKLHGNASPSRRATPTEIVDKSTNSVRNH